MCMVYDFLIRACPTALPPPRPHHPRARPPLPPAPLPPRPQPASPPRPTPSHRSRRPFGPEAAEPRPSRSASEARPRAPSREAPRPRHPRQGGARAGQPPAGSPGFGPDLLARKTLAPLFWLFSFRIINLIIQAYSMSASV